MPVWQNQAAIVIASGPSLRQEDVDLVRASGIKTVAINSTWQLVPWCDVLYAADLAWWSRNPEAARISAEKWTLSRPAAHEYKLNFRPQKITPGHNSGASAVELAANVFLANPVLMLGFDCSIRNGIHHHGPHKKLPNPTEHRCQIWKAQFKTMMKLCKRARIINCSRYTEIDCVERMDLEQALCVLG